MQQLSEHFSNKKQQFKEFFSVISDVTLKLSEQVLQQIQEEEEEALKKLGHLPSGPVQKICENMNHKMNKICIELLDEMVLTIKNNLSLSEQPSQSPFEEQNVLPVLLQSNSKQLETKSQAKSSHSNLHNQQQQPQQKQEQKQHKEQHKELNPFNNQQPQPQPQPQQQQSHQEEPQPQHKSSSINNSTNGKKNHSSIIEASTPIETLNSPLLVDNNYQLSSETKQYNFNPDPDPLTLPASDNHSNNNNKSLNNNEFSSRIATENQKNQDKRTINEGDDYNNNHSYRDYHNYHQHQQQRQQQPSYQNYSDDKHSGNPLHSFRNSQERSPDPSTGYNSVYNSKHQQPSANQPLFKPNQPFEPLHLPQPQPQPKPSEPLHLPEPKLRPHPEPESESKLQPESETQPQYLFHSHHLEPTKVNPSSSSSPSSLTKRQPHQQKVEVLKKPAICQSIDNYINKEAKQMLEKSKSPSISNKKYRQRNSFSHHNSLGNTINPTFYPSASKPKEDSLPLEEYSESPFLSIPNPTNPSSAEYPSADRKIAIAFNTGSKPNRSTTTRSPPKKGIHISKFNEFDKLLNEKIANSDNKYQQQQHNKSNNNY